MYYFLLKSVECYSGEALRVGLVQWISHALHRLSEQKLVLFTSNLSNIVAPCPLQLFYQYEHDILWNSFKTVSLIVCLSGLYYDSSNTKIFCLMENSGIFRLPQLFTFGKGKKCFKKLFPAERNIAVLVNFWLWKVIIKLEQIRRSF